MAADERTEDATPRKLQQARQEGSAPRSADIGTAAILLLVGPLFALIGGELVEDILAVSDRMFRLEDADNLYNAIARIRQVLWVIGGPVLFISFMAFLSGVAQTRTFSLKPLAFKPERLNPFPNFKSVLPSKTTALELGKQVFKVVAIGMVVYMVVSSALGAFMSLPAMSLGVASSFVAQVIERLLWMGAVAFALIAVIDFLLAVRKFKENAKMTKTEVKDEFRQQDLPPEVKQKRRRRMLESRRNVRVAVREATVVVTNPSHYAVALRYENPRDDAPVILAKGIDRVAMTMRSEARKHQIPIVENRGLARALYREGRIGEPIPLELYRATAEVIAFVLQLRQRNHGQAEAMR